MGGVKVLDKVPSFADKVVVGNNDTGNGRKEDGVGTEVGGEHVAGCKEFPWAHGKTNSSADEGTTANVDESRE